MRALVACEYSGRVREVYLDALPIEDFPGYLVTSCGRVLGCRTNFGTRNRYRFLRGSQDAKGYLGLTLCAGRKCRRKARIHRLVAEAFLPNPDHLPVVRHLDGNPINNCAENLAWGTFKDNEQDKRRHGTYDLRRSGKLSDADRAGVRSMFIDGWSQNAIATLFDVSRPTITRLLNGSTWRVDCE